MGKINNSDSQGYVYDPEKDVAPVDQFGFVDLRSAFVNGTLPSDLSVTAESYNGVEEPASLLGKSSDVFESLRKAEYVKRAGSPASVGEPTGASSLGTVAE